MKDRYNEKEAQGRYKLRRKNEQGRRLVPVLDLIQRLGQETVSVCPD